MEFNVGFLALSDTFLLTYVFFLNVLIFFNGHVQPGPMASFYETYTSQLLISISLLKNSTCHPFCKRHVKKELVFFTYAKGSCLSARRECVFFSKDCFVKLI